MKNVSNEPKVLAIPISKLRNIEFVNLPAINFSDPTKDNITKKHEDIHNRFLKEEPSRRAIKKRQKQRQATKDVPKQGPKDMLQSLTKDIPKPMTKDAPENKKRQKANLMKKRQKAVQKNVKKRQKQVKKRQKPVMKQTKKRQKQTKKSRRMGNENQIESRELEPHYNLGGDLVYSAKKNFQKRQNDTQEQTRRQGIKPDTEIAKDINPNSARKEKRRQKGKYRRLIQKFDNKHSGLDFPELNKNRNDDLLHKMK